MLANDILHTIGNTPHIRINRLFGHTHTVYIKSERSNPGGSIKDRIALSMIEAAEASGLLKPGSTIVVTPREKGMNGAVARATEIVAEAPGAWMPQQFDNPANIDVHARTTAEEIAADFPSGIDALITGVGTGGHITGCAQVLKGLWPKLKVYAVEPSASPVISGGKPSPHPIQGIGAGFIPKNLH